MTVNQQKTDQRRDGLPIQLREAPLANIDVESRTVDVVFSTGATVRRRRYTWDGTVDFDETLLVSKEAVNLSRLLAGGAVLDSHASWSTQSQVGVVERAWLEDNNAMASVRFPKAGIDEAADRMFAMVNDKIIRNISVGYSIDQVRIEKGEKRDDVENWIVERWTPMELSFVAVPADPGAQVRGNERGDCGLRAFPLQISNDRGGAELVAARMRMRQASAGR